MSNPSETGNCNELNIHLNSTTEEAYCCAAITAKHNEFWWYFTPNAPFRHYSHPLQDASGRWWYHVKPGFAWPVNYFKPIESLSRNIVHWKLLGNQYPVKNQDQANSFVWMNVIEDLQNYDIHYIHKSKRRAVKKCFNNLQIINVDPDNIQRMEQALEVWNSHVQRTGWNSYCTKEKFFASWNELTYWPGTSIIMALDPHIDRICAWLITRVIDGILYIDTIASHTTLLKNRPNDGLIFSVLSHASQNGITRAHYSLCSNIEPLEKFKESMGFKATAFPSFLSLRWIARIGLKLCSKEKLLRLYGKTTPPTISHNNGYQPV